MCLYKTYSHTYVYMICIRTFQLLKHISVLPSSCVQNDRCSSNVSKIVFALPVDTRWSCSMDTIILCIDHNSIREIIQHLKLQCSGSLAGHSSGVYECVFICAKDYTNKINIIKSSFPFRYRTLLNGCKFN